MAQRRDQSRLGMVVQGLFESGSSAVQMVGWIALWIIVFAAAVTGAFIIPTAIVVVVAIGVSLWRAVMHRVRRR